MAYDKQLPKKSENLSEWYNKVVLQAELADYGPSKGTMIFRPYGYAIWEAIRRQLDSEFKKKGVENAYFPMFIPESLLNREKEHLEGFAPELAVVTIGGGEELNERLVVRPTSETIMCETFAKWVSSWRNLPLMINQWNNVVRWEKRTYLFLRTTEFLWQEGHTAHATHEEAEGVQKWAMDTYAQMFRDYFAIPGLVGRKSESEKFAGADVTLTYEALMPEGKALQSCTSHDLGQNFSKSFGIEFQNKTGDKEYVWQTSWGLSTRSIGGLIMCHGDDKGLRLPPKLAPIQVVILPVRAETDLLEYGEKIATSLRESGLRVKVDIDDASLGWKINKWELKGVPLRLEIGKREMAENVVKVARRDNGADLTVNTPGLSDVLVEMLDEVQAALLKEAEAYLEANTHIVTTYEEFKQIMVSRKGFIRSYWCEGMDCEKAIKEETKATTRCRAEESHGHGLCIYCNKEAQNEWYFAQAY